MKIRLIFAVVVILGLVATGCQSATDTGNHSSSTTTVRAAAESYRSELPTAGTETTTGADPSGTAGVTASSTAATTAAVTTRTQQRSSAVTTVRSTSAVSDCRHYTVIPGTDIFADTLVWSVEGNYDVWTCSQCGASGRSERQKTSSQLYAEAFASGDYSELNTMETDAVRAIRGVYDALPAGADDFDKICAVADWLYENCSYDYEAAASGNALSSPAFGRWGVFTYGKAVCSGYASAFQMFMDLFEIECDEISGTANNGSGTASHAWNAVKLDGMWYYVDTTWGESWFMLSREEMAIDHFSDYYKTGRSESLSAEYLRRRYHISAGQTLTVAEVNAQIRLDMLAGKTELAYLVRGDYEFEKDWHFGDLTQAEYLTVYDQWSVHSYSSYRRGEYTVVRLIGG